MRIPIYPEDLIPQKGFKRIAKILHRDWPGPEPVNLSAAREMLARCFGYKNYHDVSRSAYEGPENVPPSEIGDLRASILITLANKLHTGSLSNSVDLEKLTAFVESLPLNVLQTYRLSRADRPER